jgi:hypothetical protein
MAAFRGWAVLPVLNSAGTMFDADIRGPATPGDRCEYEIDPANARCLVSVDVADDRRLVAGTMLCTQAQMDQTFASLPRQQRDRVRAALGELGETDMSGTMRDILRRAGRRLNANFDPNHHVGS